jgi:tetratricopeptide (TPR) repeat protein/predicted Ser/Thr protein kinase
MEDTQSLSRSDSGRDHAPVPGVPPRHETEKHWLETLPTGSARIGRFTRLERIAAGGMGVVFTAEDAELERKVAIKVLREGAASATVHARIVREAQAMAKLSHPNVAQVFEVGEYLGSMFIAMEFVQGSTLRQWQQEDERSWREVLAAYLQAGRGLAAAHAEGLVHRDFKPDNAMIGEDGRVRVLDFGLVRTEDDEQVARSEPEDDALGAPLTKTGAMPGTPAYMAPEQFLGKTADHRSDQFSFCVALFEALHGQRPFVGRTLVGLQESVLAGRVRAPPRSSPVPGRIHRLLVQGLAVRPEDRHPSLAELLRALEPDPAAAWRWRTTVGGLVVLASVGGFALATREAGEAAQPCASIEDEIATVWNDERRAAVESALRATGVLYADETWQRIEPKLDAYANDWTTMRAESCQAHVDGLEPARHHDLRTACLSRRRTAIDTLVSLLSEATPEDVVRAAQATAGLPPLETCGDLEVLTVTLPPPEDPEVARAVEAHRDTLARAREYETLGRLDEARGLVQPVIESAEANAYPPLEAEALLLLGTVELTAMRYVVATEVLSRALETSLRVGHNDVAAEAIARRIFTLSLTSRNEEAVQDVPLAQALAERADDDEIRWLLLNNAGVAHGNMLDRHQTAEEYLQAALGTTERVNGRNHFQYAVTLGNLGNLAVFAGRFRAAAEYKARALRIQEDTLGSGHPQAVRTSSDLAGAELYLGRLSAPHARLEAIDMSVGNYRVPWTLAKLGNEQELHAEALRSADGGIAMREVLDNQYPGVAAYFFVERAIALAGLKRHEEAMGALEQAQTIAAGAYDAAFFGALVDEATGRVLLEHGDAAQALIAHRRALSFYEGELHPRQLHLARSRLLVATALHALGEHDQALAAAARALEQFLAALQDCPEQLAEFRLVLGSILLDMGRTEDALEQLELGHRELLETAEPLHPKLAELELAMARTLLTSRDVQATSGADRARAAALARRALTTFRGYAPGFADEAAAAERLLRERLDRSSAEPR